jgi:DNA helicase-2/ATP-dependent DNA helicase PcrA
MTFHAAARRQLHYFWPRVVGDTGWQLLDSKFSVVAQSASRAGLHVSTDDVRDLAGEIEWAKASLISPEDYAAAVAAAGRDIPLDAANVAGVYAGYERLKAGADGMALLDFDDLLLRTAAAIENDAAVAEEFRDRYRCFVVDEYQDVTPLQQRVLNAWLGDRDDLTVVGDANQTIYSFTGATPRYLLDSPRASRRRGGALERDQVDTAGGVAGQPGDRRGPRQGGRQQAALVGQRDAGPAVVRRASRRVAEAAAVAKKITQLIGNGTPPSEIAVLYRINAQSEVYEEALTEAGVAFQVRGGEGFFSRQEIRQALLALQRAAERGADASAAELPPLVRQLLEPLGLSAEAPSGTRARERWEALTALAELVDDEVAQRPSLDLRALLAELRQRADARHPPVVPGVTLASLHAAKGLEWDAVFVVGLADGTLPISHALAHGPDSEPVEENGACSALESQGPECIWRSAGRCPEIRVAGRVDGRHASSTASRRTRRPTPRTGRESRAARRRVAASATTR